MLDVEKKSEQLRQAVQSLKHAEGNVSCDPYKLVVDYGLLEPNEIDFEPKTLEALHEKWNKNTKDKNWSEQHAELAKCAFIEYCQQFDLLEKIGGQLLKEHDELESETQNGKMLEKPAGDIYRRLREDWLFVNDLQNLMSSIVSKNTYQTAIGLGLNPSDAIGWMRDLVYTTLKTYGDVKQLDRQDWPTVCPPGKAVEDGPLANMIAEAPDKFGRHVLNTVTRRADAHLLEQNAGKGR